ncbi:MAG: hypothetical protein P4M09_21055 [Devosia sp.]|nr:hypothetical protein [Devosia sp.]
MIPVASHLRSELQSLAPPAAFVAALEYSRCRPLDAEAESAMREAAEKTANPFTLEPPVEPSSSSSSSSSVSVVILDLSASPPREVDSISAFGLVWAPIRSGFVKKAQEQIKRAAEQAELEKKKAEEEEERKKSESAADDGASKMDELIEALDALPTLTMPTVTESLVPGRSSIPASTLTPSMLPSESTSPDLVQFYSIESALFSAPPSAALGRYQQQMLQLPAALAANKAAMVEAESKGELGDIGALYIERKRLQAELRRMQTEVPPQADVVEVRDTIQLPYGLVPMGKQIYYLMRGSERDAWTGHRKLVISNIHPCGRFLPFPFASSHLGAPRTSFLGESSIFDRRVHGEAFSLVCNHQPIKATQLLYRGSRDGLTGLAWHQHVNHKGGPTLTLVRTKSKFVFAIYVAAGFTGVTGQLVTDAFLVGFGTKAEPRLQMLVTNHPETAIYQFDGRADEATARMFAVGSSAAVLNFSVNMAEGPNYAHLLTTERIYEVDPRGLLAITPESFAGANMFQIDEMETYLLAGEIDYRRKA